MKSSSKVALAFGLASLLIVVAVLAILALV